MTIEDEDLDALMHGTNGVSYMCSIMQAAQEKLITVSMTVEDAKVSETVEQVSKLYKSGERKPVHGSVCTH